MVERNLSINQAKAREYDFNQPVVSVGSHPDNDITLTGPGVLPFHATVVLESGQYHLIPMESGSVVSVDGVQLTAPQVALGSSQRVEIGNNALFFQHNGTSSSMHVKLFPLAGEDEPQQYTLEGGEKAILLNVLADDSEIDVEQSALFEFEVINAGPIVASFFVSLKGVPEEWVEISPNMVNLNEGQRHLVQIRVTPPRDASSEAGKHTLRAFITSPNYTGQKVSTDLSLTIRPYYEFSVGNLSPKDQRISWRKKTGKTFLPITNQGNGSADFNILAIDDENGCSFDFLLAEERVLNRQATTQLQAGETLELPIEITPIKHPMFSMRSKRYHYTANVTIPQNNVSPQVLSGSATSVPLFGWWSIVLGVAAILLALFFILQPNIRSFSVAAGKDVIELGDTTRLDWDVSPFATRLSITNIDPLITRGQVSQTVAPVVSTTYELVSGNWLSGLVGLDQKRSLTILVVPPSPHVNVFEVDKTSVSKGQPVNIRWSVSTADEVFLTIDEVVYPLSPEEFSGERQVILEKDALITLEAKTGSGSELQSYFVNVEPPYINIDTFTIWVRPDSAAADPSAAPVAMVAGGKRFSMVNAPDPNFPVKFVELIPDVASDNGYRVYFNPDVRTELNKGEQVMLEWNVEGADTLQIAPFTDQLPARGSQPFFPQESMNFVMTATSGDLTGIFMLPVKVFDGIPPTAPTIDFFNASPQSMLGGGEVEFSWSVSNEWTRITLSDATGVIADNLNPIGFKKIKIAASSTIILTAYNGTLSTAKPLEITVDPALIAPGLIIKSISPTTGRSMVGGQLIVTIDFSTLPEGKPYPIGEVIVTDGSAICRIPLPAVSCNLVFTTSGTKTITASFPGDKIYLQSKSAGFAQQVIVASAQVDLNPSFYFNGVDTPISVESAEFDMDKGIRTVVEVRPKNTVLADNKGSITVSVCKQDVNEAIIESTCVFAASGPVNVAIASENGRTAGYGYADIVIPNFTTTGVHGLLFEYTHASNAIDPASIFQPNVHIKRIKLILSLSYCADQFGLTTCKYGIKDGVTPEIIFDLNIPTATTPIKLSSLLPTPQTEAFNIQSSTSTWVCNVKTVSGTYKLVCSVTGLVAGSSTVVNYSYSNTDPLSSGATNHYYMGNDPDSPFGPASFTLNILSSTKTQIGNMAGVKVGQRIRLSGPSGSPGIISILTGTTRIFPSTGITLTEKSGADLFGVENEGVNCSSSANGSVVTVKAANADCFIYFKHIGPYTLVASFEGDTNYSNSTSGDTPITVSKQDQISATLQYLGDGSPTFPSSFTTKIPEPIRVLLTGPTGGFPTSTGFPPTALVGRKVLVTLSNDFSKTNCTIPTGNQIADLGGGIYEVTISEKTIEAQSGNPADNTSVTSADFSVNCTTESSSGLSFVVTFSDKTTPKKDSDDFAFTTSPVTLFQKAIAKPSLGNVTVTIKRQDTAQTNMLSSSTISQLHFGQNYTVAITDSTDIKVPYGYSFNRTYTYYWNFFYGWTYYSYSNSSNPTTLSTNARNTVISTYNTNAKWSLDPSNFLTGVDFTAASSTCGMNMSLTTSAPSYSEVANGSTIAYSGVYISGGIIFYDRTDTITVYGTQVLRLKDTTGCKLVFEGVSSNTPVLAANAGTIALSAASGDDRFVVNKIYNVDGIDKQAVSMTFTPSGAQAGYVNIPMPFTITLAPNSGIVGGTALPFISTAQNFSTYFSPSSPLTPLDVCPNLTQLGNLNPLSQVYTSSSQYSTACVPKLKYLGNKYYKNTDYQDLPGMTFGKHNSSVAFTAALPFASNGAFLETTYTGMKVRVSDGESHGQSSGPTPTGTVKVQVFKTVGGGTDTAYTCNDYTLSINPAVTCATGDGSYTLPLTAGETASFDLLFKSATVGSSNYIKLSYSGDNAYNTVTTSSTTFAVKKHVSSLGTVQYQQGQTWTNLVPTFPTMKVGQSTAMRVPVSDGDGLSHTEIPSGTVEVWMVDTNGVTLDPEATTNPVYSITLGSGLTYDSTNKLYRVTIASGYANFTLNFRFAATGLSLKCRYVGDTLFNASSTSMTGPLAFTN